MKKIQSNKIKLHVKKGDTVQVVTGDDRGKKGRVLAVFPDKQKALVEGVRYVHRHSKPSAKQPDGGIIKKEAPIHVSNLMLLDPKSGKPTRIGRKIVKDKSVRYSKKSGEVIV